MILYDQNKKKYKIKDDNEIDRGGEGRIIKLNSSNVAKIYLPGNKPIDKKSFEYLDKNIQRNEFVKPKILLYDSHGKIVGFLMDLLPKDFFTLDAAFVKSFIRRKGFDDKWKIAISKLMIDNVNYVHDRNIVIGDLSGFNTFVSDNEVRFIDVDSYETPSHPHSGKLFEDIRDHHTGGDVSKSSDQFSLSVVIFNLLTNVHPYKGVHNVHKADLVTRMKKNLSVLDSASVKVPKCYQPITDKYLRDQFIQMFEKGDRFLISFEKTSSIIIGKSDVPYAGIKVESDKLMITTIFTGKVKYIKANENFLCIATDHIIKVYGVSSKNHYTFIKDIDAATVNIVDIVLTETGIFAIVEDGTVFGLSKDNIMTHIMQIDNSGDKIMFTQTYGDSLVVVYPEKMYVLYFDDIIQNHIRHEYISVNGYSFSKITDLFKNVNGIATTFHYVKGSMDTIEFKHRIKDIVQLNSIGMIQIYKNRKTHYKLFKIEDNSLDPKYSDTSFSSMRKMGYNKDKFIVIPEDDFISFFDMNLSPMTKIECSLCDESSELAYTKAGIILNNGNGVFMLNRK